MGSHEEIPKAATFLASDDSSFITDIELVVEVGDKSRCFDASGI
jgi:hypothetical protein